MVHVLTTGSKATKARARKTTAPKGRKSAKTKRGIASSPSVADLQAQIERRTAELDRALERETAAADILRVIASSPSDVQPVFDAIVNCAATLFEPCSATITTLKDGKLHWNAIASRLPGFDPEGAKAIYPIPLDPDRSPSARAMLERRIIEIPDISAPDTPEFTRKAAAAGSFRSCTFVPLIHQDTSIGTIILIHPQAGFRLSEKQLALVQTFADQAVIAIQNARLFNETKEALARQTATADVLKVIASSPSTLQPVYDAIAERSKALIDAHSTVVVRYIDGMIQLASFTPVSPEADATVRKMFPRRPTTDDPQTEQILRGEIAQITDAESEILPPVMRDAARARGWRSRLMVPLKDDSDAIGWISITRKEPGGFADKDVELLRTFADQAVIAIQNVKLFEEVQARTRDLQDSLQQQTATADVLKIISRSSVDLKTVLDTLCETVARLCRADQAPLYRRRDDKHHLVAAWGMSEQARQFALAHPLTPGRGTLTGRVILERRAVHMPDVLQDPEYTYSEGQKTIGYRTLLGIPLLREDALLGVFAISRTRVEPFTDKEIELATSFADQAVIAIENARLFEELRDRQAELRVTFDNMGDGVAMFGADTRLAAWNRNFQTILDLPDALVAERPTYAEYVRILAERGEFGAENIEAELARRLQDTDRELRLERTRPNGRVIEVRRSTVPGGGFVLIYSDITERKRAEQAVRAARDAAESALRELQMAQASLVHAQKMAALGQLTAGIAHEIKNPLNFVNNFAALSSELTDELSDLLKPVALPGKVREEVEELTGTLKDNLDKVEQHGKRADSIVKNMLLHSREGSGEHRPADINALVDESLNLAYHGARAEKQGFNITLQRDLDPAAGMADVYPQEITRVLLNLISNGFYAATKRASGTADDFEPTLCATTKNLGDKVEIRIRDNGIGIPPELKEKIFNPFFTTKPAGEGTGLGLSMSHDIVVKQHGGTIDVNSEPGVFTEFTITLPRTNIAQ
jgi:signal transduction histidine kinase